MNKKKTEEIPFWKELLNCGEIIKVNNFETQCGYYTIRIIKMNRRLYFHKMKNGNIVEVMQLA